VRFHGKRLLITASQPLHRLDAGAAPGRVVAVTGEGVDVACAPGVVRLLRLKPEGRGEMAAAEWARGARVEPGAAFEDVGAGVSAVRERETRGVNAGDAA
jgi:methionyl-tRNA formyltransferase